MPQSGFDIIVNGVPRTFRDTEAAALDAAQMLAGRQGNELVQVRSCENGKTVTVTSTGRATKI